MTLAILKILCFNVAIFLQYKVYLKFVCSKIDENLRKLLFMISSIDINLRKLSSGKVNLRQLTSIFCQISYEV